MAKEAGFSLHAGVSTEPHQRDKLERLCRYVTRPAVSEKRLALTSSGSGSDQRNLIISLRKATQARPKTRLHRVFARKIVTS